MNLMLATFLGAALLMARVDKPASAPTAPSSTSVTADASKGPLAVIVTLADSRPLKDVVADLAQQGLVVDNVLEAVGIVTGHVASSAAMTKLGAVAGVKAVELDVPVSIA